MNFFHILLRREIIMNLLKYQIFSKVVEIGTVKIGTFSSVSIQWMPQIIKQFQNQFPHIEIKLLDGNYSEIEEWIADGTADLGFVNLPSKYTPRNDSVTSPRQCMLSPIRRRALSFYWHCSRLH